MTRGSNEAFRRSFSMSTVPLIPIDHALAIEISTGLVIPLRNVLEGLTTILFKLGVRTSRVNMCCQQTQTIRHVAVFGVLGQNLDREGPCNFLLTGLDRFLPNLVKIET